MYFTNFFRKNTIKNYSGEEHTDLFDNEGWRCCLFLLLSWISCSLILFCEPSQVLNHLLHLRWNRGGSTGGTDSDKGQTNGDYSNGILSFLPLSPVFSFHLYIKVGLWISTELTEFSTRRSSWMKREKSVIMSWIRWFTRIRFSERIGVWSIDNKHNTIWGWIVPHMETTQPHLLVFF